MISSLGLVNFAAALGVVFASSQLPYQTVDYDYGVDEDASLPRNLIMMIPDGTSPNVFTLARTVLDPTLETRLHVDNILAGSVKTSASDSFITDSAAAATAYATGFKTSNRAISVDEDKRPLGTILEAAVDRGMVAGMVVTSRVTHATPACFASHVDERDLENEIASQYVDKKQLDYLFGGGKRHFEPEQFAELKEHGYEVVFDADELMALPDTTTKAFGVFSKSHMAFEMDRHATKEPALTESVAKVLAMLEKNEKAKKNGFFLMIEGSRVDTAGHQNDPATMAKEAIEFDRAVGLVKEFIDKHKNTALLSAADHGCGGLGLGIDNIYALKPEALHNVTMSTEALMKKYLEPLVSSSVVAEKHTTLVEFIKGWLVEHAQIAWKDVKEKRKEELAARINHLLDDGKGLYDVREVVAHIVSDAAMIGWTSAGHVAGDVNLHCYGPRDFERSCRGNHENTHVNFLMRKFLQLNQQEQTLKHRFPHDRYQ